jgi:very-short-patch-repair endonuclease/predicted DNA-binding protein YlxM (UPF0122 family)
METENLIERDKKGRFVNGRIKSKIWDNQKLIVDKYLEGFSGTEIAKDFRCSRSLIYEILKENIVKIKKQRKTENKKVNEYAWNNQKEIINLYNQDTPILEISNKLKISRSLVYTILKKNNIKIKPGGYFQKGKKYQNRLGLPEDKIIDMYTTKNIPIYKISKLFKCNGVVIYRILRENGIPIKNTSFYTKGREAHNKLNLDNLKIIGLYKDGMSGKRISKVFNCSPCVIYKILKKNVIYQKIPRTEETRRKIKEARAKQILPIKDTSIEVKIQNFLKQLNIEFFTHQYMRITNGYQCDILIPSKNLVIECDGDFIHCNPKIYSADFVRFPNGNDKRRAKDVWEMDNKRTKELEEKGYRVIRLWENEIYAMNLNKFKRRIENG